MRLNLDDNDLLTLPREELQDLVSRINRVLLQHEPRYGKVIRLVAEFYNLSPALLLQSISSDWICWPRFVAMNLLKEAFPGTSDQRIADIFKKERSLVSYARTHVRAMCAMKPDLAGELAELRARLPEVTQ